MRRDDAVVPLAEIEATVPVEYPRRPVGFRVDAGGPANRAWRPPPHTGWRSGPE